MLVRRIMRGEWAIALAGIVAGTAAAIVLSTGVLGPALSP